MAMRDQIIHNQREAQRNLWNLLMSLGFDEKKILDFAARQGLANEDSTMTPYLGQSDWKQSPILDYGTSIPSCCCPCTGKTYSTSSCSFKCHQDFGSRSMRGHWDLAHTFCREEHHSSYYMLSNNHSPSAFLRLRRSSEHWISGRPSSWFETPDNHHLQDIHKSFPDMKIQSSPSAAELGQQVIKGGLLCFQLILSIMFCTSLNLYQTFHAGSME